MTQHKSNSPTALTVVRQLVKVLNVKDMDAAQQLHSEDYSGFDTTHSTPTVGPLEARAVYARAAAAFPDFHLRIVDLITDRRRVSAHWIFEGTHLGSLLHIPATQRHVSFEGYTMLTVEAAGIQSSHTLWDMAGLLRQLGLLPALPEDRE
jgi:steroid delta-isomerase-like uncharacterized protein